MAIQTQAAPRKRRLSLSVYVSGLLMLAVIIPLTITVSIIVLLSRPTLITQTSKEMETDAKTRAQLIDSYFSERILEAEALSRLPAIQNYLAGDTTQQARAAEGLATGHGRGSHYEDWSLFDLHDTLSLYYPFIPQKHGNYFILPTDQQQLLVSKKAVLSNVFFSPVSNEAYIDIYTPIVTSSYTLVGILRTTFDLQYIWDIVNNEAGANGPGSYAFILDPNGVRIAYTNMHPDPAGLTNSPDLFKAIAPIPATTQSLINDEGLYGQSGHSTVPVLADAALTKIQQGTNLADTFQMTPAGQQETFQMVRSTTYTVPWSYFVLSPLSTVTAPADQQLLIIGIITLIISFFAALLGLVIGHRITSPIQHSVHALVNNSVSLKELSSRTKSAAKEQIWVVESSQIGLHKVEYYTNATNQAARRLATIGTELMRNWQHLNEQQAVQIFGEIITAARYIENARIYQEESSDNLSTAIRVTTQVTEQLTTDATSVSEAATQLEQVVKQLRAVVGK